MCQHRIPKELASKLRLLRIHYVPKGGTGAGGVEGLLDQVELINNSLAIGRNILFERLKS